MTPEELQQIMSAVSGAVSKAVDPLTQRLEALETALKGGGKLVKIGDRYVVVDPEKMNASTQNPEKLPSLRVIETGKGGGAPGTPGGQLTEPKPPQPGFAG